MQSNTTYPPVKLVTVSEMQAIEKAADAAGHTYATMMEHAGRGLAEIIEETYGYLAEEGILGLIGSGNNGGIWQKATGSARPF